SCGGVVLFRDALELLRLSSQVGCRGARIRSARPVGAGRQLVSCASLTGSRQSGAITHRLHRATGVWSLGVSPRAGYSGLLGQRHAESVVVSRRHGGAATAARWFLDAVAVPLVDAEGPIRRWR